MTRLWVVSSLVCLLAAMGCGLDNASVSENPGQDGASSRSDLTPTSHGSPTGLTAQDDASPGIGIGETAPDFELKDQTGKPRKLKDLLEQGTVALVFYRSADW